MEEKKNINITITITPYGYGMILEAMRVLAENDKSLRADATRLRKEILERIESAQREEAVRMRWDKDPDVRGGNDEL